MTVSSTLQNFRFFPVVGPTSSPFSSGTPLFCRTQTLVLYSVQLIRNTCLQDHNANTMIHFLPHFFHYPCLRIFTDISALIHCFSNQHISRIFTGIYAITNTSPSKDEIGQKNEEVYSSQSVSLFPGTL